MATMSLSKLLFIILVTKSLIFAEALKCYQCGQYNDGVGSITPCLNYTEQTAPFYLKDCPRSSDAYCIKYKSELSENSIRDCVASCTEKEVWNTRTYCCNVDACNDAFTITISKTALVPVLVATLYASTAVMFRRQ